MIAKTMNGKSKDCDQMDHEQRELLVQAGDVQELFEMISSESPSFVDLRTAFGQIRRALEQASRGNPCTFTNDSFRSMTTFVRFVLLRLELLCRRELQINDPTGSNQNGRISEEFQTNLLPLVERMQSHLATLLQLWASTTKLWQMAARCKSKASAKAKPEYIHPGDTLARQAAARRESMSMDFDS